MAFVPSSPLTGASQTGLTSPTYTHVEDTSPLARAVQRAVTALGGTQTGVTTHSVSSPFTITIELPANFKQVGPVNPVTGKIGFQPRNTAKVRTRKGVTPLAGQATQTMVIETKISVPAGADLADAANIRAALSAHIGALWDQSDETGDASILGLI